MCFFFLRGKTYTPTHARAAAGLPQWWKKINGKNYFQPLAGDGAKPSKEWQTDRAKLEAAANYRSLARLSRMLFTRGFPFFARSLPFFCSDVCLWLLRGGKNGRHRRWKNLIIYTVRPMGAPKCAGIRVKHPYALGQRERERGIECSITVHYAFSEA